MTNLFSCSLSHKGSTEHLEKLLILLAFWGEIKSINFDISDRSMEKCEHLSSRGGFELAGFQQPLVELKVIQHLS